MSRFPCPGGFGRADPRERAAVALRPGSASPRGQRDWPTHSPRNAVQGSWSVGNVTKPPAIPLPAALTTPPRRPSTSRFMRSAH